MTYAHVWFLNDSFGNRSTLTVRERDDQTLTYSLAGEAGTPLSIGNITTRSTARRPRMTMGRDALTLTEDIRRWLDTCLTTVTGEEGQVSNAR